MFRFKVLLLLLLLGVNCMAEEKGVRWISANKD